MTVERAKLGLKCLVARVNSSTQLVLNVGAEDGVMPGDIFRIMSDEGIPVNDPKSGEQIGTLPVEKARIKVKSAYPKISVAETYRTYKVGGVSSLGNIFGPEREVTETMSVETSPEYEVDETVRVGDTATLISVAK